MADDEFIPFDPPIVSKYGPISRMSKTILRPNSTVQVSASFGDGTISTPMVRRPVPAASPVASWYLNAAQGEFQYAPQLQDCKHLLLWMNKCPGNTGIIHVQI
jgi:RING finger/CCCH-type zinc finger protein